MAPIDPTSYRQEQQHHDNSTEDGEGLPLASNSSSSYHQYQAHRRRRQQQGSMASDPTVIASNYPKFAASLKTLNSSSTNRNAGIASSNHHLADTSMDTELGIQHASPERANGKILQQAPHIKKSHKNQQHFDAIGKRKGSSLLCSMIRSILGFCLGCLALAFVIHRSVSSVRAHKKWINAPITYLSRQCPAVSYEVLPKSIISEDTAPKICLTSLTDQQSPSFWQRLLRWRNFDGILDLTWPNKQAYALQYGYHLYDGSHHIDHSRPPAWSKIVAVKYLLQHEDCDWVMWTDADTIIMNSEIRITDFLPTDTTKHLIVGPDKGGGFNSGVFLFRNTDWSIQTLDAWWNMTDFVRPHGMSLSGDNSALKALLKHMPDFDEHVLSPPRCTFNSFAKFLTLQQSREAMDHLTEQSWYMDDEHYHKGDFIAHTPGVDNKIACLKLLLPESR
jgi:galactosyl transferase GMA12/MNN10 family